MKDTFIELPTVDSLNEVVLADGRALSVRVVYTKDMTIVVAATMLRAGVAPPVVGDSVTLRWAGRRGRCAAPCRVRAVDPRQFATWTLEAGGGVEIEQRRRFARAAGLGPIQLGPAEPEVGVILIGELIDIGEGGLRCRLAGTGVDPEQPVFVRILLDGRVMMLHGTVLRLGPGVAGSETDTVVTFQATATQARQIRRYVLHRQSADRARTDGAG
jgi:PilZ domain